MGAARARRPPAERPPHAPAASAKAWRLARTGFKATLTLGGSASVAMKPDKAHPTLCHKLLCSAASCGRAERRGA